MNYAPTVIQRRWYKIMYFPTFKTWLWVGYVIFSLLLWSFVHERNWGGRKLQPCKVQNVTDSPDLGTSRRKVEAGAHIAHFGSPVIRRDTIATTTAKNADLFPLRTYRWELKSEWPKPRGLRLCARLAASMNRKIKWCNMYDSCLLNLQQWTKQK